MTWKREMNGEVRAMPRLPALAVLLIVSSACGGGDRNVVEPPLPEPTDFTLTVRPHPDDAAVAQQLGWSGGIPSLEVTITPEEGSGAPRVVTTGADGMVRMDALAPGSYRVSARRLLTDAERSKLGAGGDVVAFVGEETVSVGANTRTTTVQLPASRRRSLVISEWAFNSRLIFGVGNYMYGGYLELYNNSDTTIYLDGVLIAPPFAAAYALPHLSCEAAAPYSKDPDGLWTAEIAAFPGSGREYPLAPGENVVVATDAIDHSALFPGMVDLSGASFEFTGPADVDNPTVPNMLNVGPRTAIDHGMAFPGSLNFVAVVGEAVDPATLRRGTSVVQGQPWLRIDRERTLDVIASTSTYLLTVQPPAAFCDAMISTAIDRKHGFFLRDDPDEYQVSISRKVLGSLPDGRPLLQHTRTSANDFHRTLRTPGVVK